MADEVATTAVDAGDVVGWHAEARSGLASLLLRAGLGTRRVGQRSGDADYLRAQIFIL